MAKRFRQDIIYNKQTFLPKRKNGKEIQCFILSTIISSCLTFLAQPFCLALPEGYNTVSGNVKYSTPDSKTLNVNSSSTRSIVNYQKFNIGSDETVNFNLPNSQSTILNRVVGNNSSQIFGKINSNGQVFLINPSGILFGKTSQINVHSLFTTTRNITNNDFLNKNYKFTKLEGYSNDKISNYGNITAKGYVVLAGSSINNQGNIDVPEGSVNLAVGDKIAVDIDDNIKVNVTIDKPLQEHITDAQESVKNSGSITANSVKIQADLENNILTNVINNEGCIKASGAVSKNGVIELIASSDNGNAVVNNTGTIDVSGSASSPNAGRITVQGDKTINNGSLLAKGAAKGKGGTVQVLGNEVNLSEKSYIDVSGDIEGGTALIGGDYQGKGSILNSKFTTVDSGSVINADAISSGDGGKVIVWADDTTKYYGSITSRGGALSGDGGFVEVSGKKTLKFYGKTNLSAKNGKFGTLFLDPATFSIPGDMTEEALEASAADANVMISADNGVTMDSADGLFNLQLTSGFININADYNNDGIGTFNMDPNDTIRTEGGTIYIYGGILNLGSLNTRGVANDKTGSIGITGEKQVNVANNVSIKSGGYITMSGYDNGSINIESGTNISSGTYINIGDNFNNSSINVSGNLSAGTYVYISNYKTGSTTNISGNLTSSGGSITITGREVNINPHTILNSSVDANIYNSSSGSITIDGTSSITASTGKILIGRNTLNDCGFGPIEIESGAALSSSSGIYIRTYQNGADITLGSLSLSCPLTVDTYSQASDINLTGNITSTSTVDIESGKNILFSPNVSIDSSSTTLEVNKNSSSAETFTLDSTNQLTSSGNIYIRNNSLGSTTINSGANISSSSTTISDGLHVSLGDANITGSLRINNGIANADIDLPDSINYPLNVISSGTGSDFILDSLSSSSSIEFNISNRNTVLDSNASLTSTGSTVTITGTNISLNPGSSISGSGDVNIYNNSSGIITIDGTSSISSSAGKIYIGRNNLNNYGYGSIVINSGATLSSSSGTYLRTYQNGADIALGSLSLSGPLTVDTYSFASDINFTGNISSSGAITASSGRYIYINPNLTINAGNISLSSSSGIVVNAGTDGYDQVNLLSSGTLYFNNTVYVPSTVELIKLKGANINSPASPIVSTTGAVFYEDTSGTLTVNQALVDKLGSGDLTIKSASAMSPSAITVANRNLTFEAPSFTVGSAINTGTGSVSLLQDTGSYSLTQAISDCLTGSSINITALAGNVSLAGSINAGSKAFSFTGQDINSGSYTLNTTGNVILTDTVGDLAISNSYISSFGTGNLAVNITGAGNNLTLAENINAGSRALTLSSNNQINSGSYNITTSGDLSMTAASSINMNIGGTGSVSANGTNVTLSGSALKLKTLTSSGYLDLTSDNFSFASGASINPTGMLYVKKSTNTASFSSTNIGDILNVTTLHDGLTIGSDNYKGNVTTSNVSFQNKNVNINTQGSVSLGGVNSTGIITIDNKLNGTPDATEASSVSIDGYNLVLGNIFSLSHLFLEANNQVNLSSNKSVSAPGYISLVCNNGTTTLESGSSIISPNGVVDIYGTSVNLNDHTSVNADGNISIAGTNASGTITISGTSNISSSSGDIYIGTDEAWNYGYGAVTVNSGATLSTSNNINIFSDNNITLGNLTLTGNLYFGTGDNADLLINGDINSPGEVYLWSGRNIGFGENASISATGDIEFYLNSETNNSGSLILGSTNSLSSTSGSIDIKNNDYGSTVINTGATISTSVGINIYDGLHVSLGDLDVGSVKVTNYVANSDIKILGDINSTGLIDINASGSDSTVNISGNLTSTTDTINVIGGTVNLNANKSISAYDNVSLAGSSTTGTVTIDGTSSISSSNGDIYIGTDEYWNYGLGSVVVNSGATLSTSGYTFVGAQNDGSSITLGSLDVTGSLYVDTYSHSSDINLTGNITSTGEVFIGSGRNLTLSTNVSITSAGDLELRENYLSDNSSTFTLDDTNSLVSTGGSISIYNNSLGSTVINSGATISSFTGTSIYDGLHVSLGSINTESISINNSIDNADINILGAINSTGLIDINAYGSDSTVNISGNLSSVNLINVNASESDSTVNISGNLTSTTGSINVTGGTVNLNANKSISAYDNVSLAGSSTTGTVTIDGTSSISSSNGNIYIGADENWNYGYGSVVINSGAALSSSGYTFIGAQNDGSNITLGSLDVTGSLYVDTYSQTSDINLTGNITSTGEVCIESSRNITLSQNVSITSAGDLELRENYLSDNSSTFILDNTNSLVSTGGSISIYNNDFGSTIINSGATISSSADINIYNGLHVSLGAINAESISISNSVDNADINILGDLNSTGYIGIVAFESNSTINISGNLTSTNNMINVTGGTINLNANKSISAHDDVSLLGNSATGTITIDGTSSISSSAGDIYIGADEYWQYGYGSIIVNSGATLDPNGSTNISALYDGANVTLGSLNLTKTLYAQASSASSDFNLTGNITSSDAVYIGGGRNLLINPNVTINASSDIFLYGETGISVNAGTAGYDQVNLLSGGELNLNQTVTVPDTVEYIKLKGTNITSSASPIVSSTGTIFYEDTSGTLTVNQDLVDKLGSGDLTIKSASAMSPSAITVNRNVTLEAPTVTLNSVINTGTGSLNVVNDSGIFSITQAIVNNMAGNTLEVTANNISLGESITAGSKIFNLTANDFSSSGYILSTTGNITLTDDAGGMALSNALVNAFGSGNLYVNVTGSGNNLILANDISAGNRVLTLTSENQINSGSYKITTSGDLSMSAASSINMNIGGIGSVSANGTNITLSGSALKLKTLTSSGNIDLTSDNFSFASGASINPTGMLYVRKSTGTIDFSSTSISDILNVATLHDGLTIGSDNYTGNVTTSNISFQNKNVNINTQGTVSLSGINSTGVISVDNKLNGTPDAATEANGVTISGSNLVLGNIFSRSNISISNTTGTTTLNSGSTMSNTSGTVTVLGKTINLNLNSSINGSGNVNILGYDATGAITLGANSSITSSTGNIYIGEDSNNTYGNSPITIGSGVTLSSSGGTIIKTQHTGANITFGNLSLTHSLSVNTGSDILLSGNISSDSSVSLTSSANILFDNNASINSSGSVGLTINSTGSFTLDGTNSITGSSVSIVNNSGTITLDSGSNITSTGSTVTVQGKTINLNTGSSISGSGNINILGYDSTGSITLDGNSITSSTGNIYIGSDNNNNYGKSDILVNSGTILTPTTGTTYIKTVYDGANITIGNLSLSRPLSVDTSVYLSDITLTDDISSSSSISLNSGRDIIINPDLSISASSISLSGRNQINVNTGTTLNATSSISIYNNLGTTTLSSGSALSVSNGTVNIQGKNINLNANSSVSGSGHVNIVGDNSSGTITIDGLSSISSSTGNIYVGLNSNNSYGAGKIVINSGAILSPSGTIYLRTQNTGANITIGSLNLNKPLFVSAGGGFASTLTLAGNISSTSSFYLSAYGNILFNSDLSLNSTNLFKAEATDTITVSSGTSISSSASNVDMVARNINLKANSSISAATNVDISGNATGGTITLDDASSISSNSGNIYIGEDYAALAGYGSIVINSGVTFSPLGTTYIRTQRDGANINIGNLGTSSSRTKPLVISTNSNLSDIELTGSLYSSGTVSLTSGKNILLSPNTSIDANGAVTLSASSGITVNVGTAGYDEVDLLSGGVLSLNKTIVVPSTIELIKLKGTDISSSATPIVSTTGSVFYEDTSGTLTVNQTLVDKLGSGNLTIKSASTMSPSAITVTSRNLTFEAPSFTIGSAINTGTGTVSLIQDTDSFTLTQAIINNLSGSSINITANAGNITLGDDVSAGNKAFNYVAEDFSSGGFSLATTGNVTLNDNDGGLALSNSVVNAYGTGNLYVNVTGTGNDLTLADSISTGSRALTLTSSDQINSGSYSITTSGNLSLSATSTVDMNIGGSGAVSASGTDVTLSGLALKLKTLTASGNIDLTSDSYSFASGASINPTGMLYVRKSTNTDFSSTDISNILNVTTLQAGLTIGNDNYTGNVTTSNINFQNKNVNINTQGTVSLSGINSTGTITVDNKLNGIPDAATEANGVTISGSNIVLGNIFSRNDININTWSGTTNLSAASSITSISGVVSILGAHINLNANSSIDSYGDVNMANHNDYIMGSIILDGTSCITSTNGNVNVGSDSHYGNITVNSGATFNPFGTATIQTYCYSTNITLGDLTLDKPLVVNAGSGFNSTNITLTGDISSTSTVSITSGSNISFNPNASIDADGAISVSAHGQVNIANGTAISSDGNISIDNNWGTTTLASGSSLTSTAGTVSIQGLNTNLNANSSINSYGDVSIANYMCYADGSITLDGLGSITSTNGNINIGDGSNYASVTVNSGAILNPNGTVYIRSYHNGHTVTIGDLNLTKPLVLNAGNGYSADLVLKGDITSTSTVSLSAASNILFDPNTSIDADGAISFSAPGLINFASGTAITSDGNISINHGWGTTTLCSGSSLTSTAGTVDIQDLNINLNANSSINSYGDVSLAHYMYYAAGTITLDGLSSITSTNGNINVGTSSSYSSVTVNSGAILNPNGTVYLRSYHNGHTVTIGDLTLNKPLVVNAGSGYSADLVLTGDISSTSSVSLAAANNILLDPNISIDAGGAVSFSASSGISVNAGTAGYDEVDLLSGGVLSLNRTIVVPSSVELIKLKGTDISSSANPIISATGSVFYEDTAGTLTVNQTLVDKLGSGNLTIKSASMLSPSAITVANRNITFEAPSFAIGSAINTGTGSFNLVLDSDTFSLTQAIVNNMTGSTLNITAANITLGDAISAGNKIFNFVAEDFSSGGFSLATTGNVTLNDNDGGLALSNSVVNAYGIGNLYVNVTGTGNDLTLADSISTGSRALTLTSSDQINSGSCSITTSGNISLSATSTVNMNIGGTGAVSASGTDIILSGSALKLKTLTASGDIDLTSDSFSVASGAAINQTGMLYLRRLTNADFGSIEIKNITNVTTLHEGITIGSNSYTGNVTSSDNSFQSKNVNINTQGAVSVSGYSGSGIISVDSKLNGISDATEASSVYIQGYYSNLGKVFANSNISIDNWYGTAELSTGAALASAAGTVGISARSIILNENSSISSYGNVSLVDVDASGSAFTVPGTSSIISSNGNIYIGASSTGSFGNSPVVVNPGATLSAFGSTYIRTSGPNVTLGSIDLTNPLVIDTGSWNGSIVKIAGDITSNSSVSISSGNSIVFDSNTSLSSTGNISFNACVQTTFGSESSVSSSGNINISNQWGSATLESGASLTSTAGTVSLWLSNTHLNPNASISSYGDASIITTSAGCTLDGLSRITSTNGNINIGASSSSGWGNGNIMINSGAILSPYGTTYINLNGENGSITIKSIDLTKPLSVSTYPWRGSSVTIAGDITTTSSISIDSGASLAFDTDSSINSLGNINLNADGNINFNSGTTINSSGNLSSYTWYGTTTLPSGSSLTSTSGEVSLWGKSLNLNSSINSHGNVNIVSTDASGSTTIDSLSNIASSTGNIYIGSSATNDFGNGIITINSGAILSPFGNTYVRLNGESGNIIIKSIDLTKPLNISTYPWRGSNVTIVGDITSISSVSIDSGASLIFDADSSINTTSTISAEADGNISLSSGTALSSSGNLGLVTWYGTTTLSSGSSLTSSAGGASIWGKSINLNSGTSINSYGDVNLIGVDSVGLITVGSNITSSTGNIYIGMTSGGSFGNSPVTINSGTVFSPSGTTNIRTWNNGTHITLGSLSTNKPLSVTTGSSAYTYASDIINTGTIASTSTVSLASSRSILLNRNTSINTSGAVSLAAYSGGISVNEGTDGYDEVDLLSGGVLSLNKTIVVPSTVELIKLKGTDISSSANPIVSTTSSVFYEDTSGTLTVNQTLVDKLGSRDLTIKSVSAMSPSAITVADRNLTFEAPSFAIGSAINTGTGTVSLIQDTGSFSLTQNAANNLSGSSINITANAGNITLGDAINAGSKIFKFTALDFSSGGYSLATTGNVTLNDISGGLALSNAVANAYGSNTLFVDVTGTGNDLTLADYINAGSRALTLTSSDQINSDLYNIATSGNLSMTASSSINMNIGGSGAVSAIGTNITLSGSALKLKTITSSGNLDLTSDSYTLASGAAINSGNTLSIKRLTNTDLGSNELDNLLSVSTLGGALTIGSNNYTGNIASVGADFQNQDVNINTQGSVSLTGAINAGLITVDNGLNGSYDSGSESANVTISETSLTLGKIYSKGNILLTTIDDSIINNDIQALGAITVNTTGNLTINSDINSSSVLIQNTGDSSHSDIIIVSGKSISATGSGNSLVISTVNGNFINNSDASALSASSGRWLVYSSDPASIVKGGLVANKLYNKTYSDNAPNTIPAGNYMLYSIRPTLTITADSKSRTYGVANPTFTGSVTGFIDGDILSTAISGSPTYTCFATVTSGVGNYNITPSAVSNLGYTFDFVNGSLEVTPAPLIVSAHNTSKIYGSNNPVFNAGYTGFVNNDSSASLTGNLSFTTSADSYSSVGTYSVTLSGLSSNNYSITYQDGSLTVTPKAITVTGNDTSKIYGNRNPALTISASGLVGNDTLSTLGNITVSTKATQSSGVGVYYVRPAGPSSSANYTISYVDGYLTISQIIDNSINDANNAVTELLKSQNVNTQQFSLNQQNTALSNQIPNIEIKSLPDIPNVNNHPDSQPNINIQTDNPATPDSGQHYSIQDNQQPPSSIDEAPNNLLILPEFRKKKMRLSITQSKSAESPK